MMQALLLILALLGSGAGRPANDREREVDLIELNHKYSEEGQHQFEQIIFWKWSPIFRRYDAIGWVIVNEKYELCGYPVEVGEFWQCRVVNPNGSRRVIRSRMFRETVTCVDPERESAKLQEKPLRSILE